MQGARFESGLDNSPMYDAPSYDPATHQMELADVGLMGLYVADCNALATIADILDKTDEAKGLRQRADKYRTSLAALWDQKSITRKTPRCGVDSDSKHHCYESGY